MREPEAQAREADGPAAAPGGAVLGHLIATPLDERLTLGDVAVDVDVGRSGHGSSLLPRVPLNIGGSPRTDPLIYSRIASGTLRCGFAITR